MTTNPATTNLTSIVLPIHNQAGHIEEILSSYRDAVGQLPGEFQFVLVTNACRDRSPEICAAIAAAGERDLHIDLEAGGWGLAVKRGLAAAEGNLLCYTNSARTGPEELTIVLAYGLAYPETVLKANRRVRDSIRRRMGSLIYNIECRLLFELATWDINGTPKAFPRKFGRLLELSSEDDLIDAEFAITCKEQHYPVIEVPILATDRHGGKSTTNARSALRMYVGAWRMKRTRA